MAYDFKLSERFVDKYKNKKPCFGFNGLGELVFYRTYSRSRCSNCGSYSFKEGFVCRSCDSNKKHNEEWWETVERVTNGVYSIQKRHIINHNLGWIENKAQKSAEEFYDRMFNMKFLPAGRQIWGLGSPIIEEKNLFMSLHNCSAISTRTLKEDPLKPFRFLMDASMLGCIAEGALIGTDRGARYIEELDGIPFTASVNGISYVAPLGSWCTGEKEVLRVETRGGYSLELTKDHTLNRIQKNRTNNKVTLKRELIPLEDLNVGDLIELNNNREVYSWEGRGTYEEGYLSGLMMADGWYNSHNAVVVVYHKDEGYEGIKEHALECVGKVDRRSIAIDWRPDNKKDVSCLTIGNWVSDYLTKSPKSIISKAVECSSYDFHCGFLRGVFDGDGSVTIFDDNKDYNISLSQSNLETLKVVQRMLLRVGIQSNICIKRRDAIRGKIQGRECDIRKSWSLYISGDNIPIFNKKIGFSHVIKREKLLKILEIKKNSSREFNQKYFLDEVKSIVSSGIKKVYDISVPDFNYFDANGLLVHNCGVGFDVRGAGQIKIKGPNNEREKIKFIVPDTREGWVDSVSVLLESYFFNTAEVEFDYSQIRPIDTPLITFGGYSSGSGPLVKLHKDLRLLLDGRVGERISARDIVDIMNLIGVCVVSGNIRRSAELVVGDYNDEEFINLKNYVLNPERESWGWMSNNSVLAKLGIDYTELAKLTLNNGEPGYLWLENAQKYGRMKDPPDNKDNRCNIPNPCSEIILEGDFGELCTLSENYPARHETLEDFKRTLKFSYLLAKTVTLGETHWTDTNRVMLRNRRIGVSLSGIAQFIEERGINEFIKWCDEGYNKIKEYDEVYSDWFCIPRSIKLTTVKPSGSISLLNSSTPGMHYPEYKHYIRRVRLAKNSKLTMALSKAGYPVEPANEDPDATVVVEVPISMGDKMRTVEEVPMWEQLSLAEVLQSHWADNAVSCTISCDKKKEGHLIEKALNYFQYKLKSISFLPRTTKRGAPYKQMPYEAITLKEYKKRLSKLKPLNFKNLDETAEPEQYCDNDTCTI